jgi:Carbohydrate family 9 binding domain-like/Secretion system C-terminal sorting domain
MKKKLLFFSLGVLMSMSTFAQLKELLINGDFSLPADGKKYGLDTSHAVPGWTTDSKTLNSVNREGYYMATMNFGAPSIYQVVDTISADQKVYKVSFLGHISWDPSGVSDTVTMTAKLSAFSGTDRTSRVVFDSINFLMIVADGKTSNSLANYVGTFTIPAASAYAGDSLVLELDLTKVTRAPGTLDAPWVEFDNVSFMSANNSDVTLANGDFSLPADGKKYGLDTSSVPGWYTDDTHNNSVNREGAYTASFVNYAKSLYTVIGTVNSYENLYNVGFSAKLDWDASSEDTVTLTVSLSAFKGDRKNRSIITSKDYILLDGSGNSAAWINNIQEALDIAAGSKYAGDSLALEFDVTKWVKAPNDSNVWTLLDNVVVTTAAGTFIPWSTFPIANVLDGKHLPSYFNANVSLRWDADTLYTKYSVKDGYIVHKGTNNYTIDNIELYFDMFNGKLANWPRDNGWPPAFTNGVNGYYQYRVINDSSWTSPYIGNLAKSAGTKLTYTYNPADSIYTYTVNFLIDSLRKGYTPNVGDSIGFETNVSDNDSTPYYRNQIDWHSPLLTLYCDPASWGTLQFADGGLFNNILDNKAPSVPANLAATVDTTSAKLTWDASTDNTVVQDYVLYDGTTVIDTILAKKTANSFTFKGLSIGSHTLGVAAMDLYKNKSAKATATAVIVPTGINGTSVASVKLSPNPVNDFININSQDVIKSAEVILITGQTAKSMNFINSPSVRINISDLQNGIYLVRVRTASGISVQRFVKQ